MAAPTCGSTDWVRFISAKENGLSVFLAIGFAIVALIYSSVGFGGGSTYTALLVFSGLEIYLVPIISLFCNLTVTTSGVWKAKRSGLYEGSGVLPILALSVPAAFLGGLTPVSRETLILLLGFALLFAGLQLSWTTFTVKKPDETSQRKLPAFAAPVIGLGVGYLSGLVGIGGGIFLAPILHFVDWSSPRKIAAIASAYIAANSAAGLAGKIIANPMVIDRGLFLEYWPLIPAVIVGSWIGHKFMLGVFPERIVKGVTAILILIVAARLLYRSFAGG